MEVKLTNSAKDFLMFSYFGIDLQEDEKDPQREIAMKCAERAYRDMCRTLTFNEKMDGKNAKEKKDIEKNRKKFRDDICDLIVVEVKKLFEDGKDNFDDWHSATCNEIMKKAKECPGFYEQKLLGKRNEDDKEVFYYGQAQKWINMTIKYMLMFDCFRDYRRNYEEKLHVPVDSYVIKAAKKLQKKLKEKNLGIDIKFPANVWSKLKVDEYINFQKTLKCALEKLADIEPNKSEYKSRYKWEEKEWVEIAKEERDQENKK